MNTQIIPFAFDSRAVRSLMLDGEPWFVAKDIAELLGYANHADAIAKHCKGVAKRYPLQTVGGAQETRIIAEPDVWRLIVRSKLPEAQAIEAWLFEEVLPRLRRTGRYDAGTHNEQPTIPATEALRLKDEMLDIQRKLIAAQERLLAANGKHKKKRPHTNTTSEEIARMRRLRAEGYSMAEIAHRTGRSVAVVSYATRDVVMSTDLFAAQGQ